jgi:hypothetical protein
MSLDRTWFNTLVDDDGSGTTGSIFDVADIDALMDAIDAELPTTWTVVAHSAANFTGNGAMTWTVASGDQTTYAYAKGGKKTLTVSFWIAGSTVGGTPNTDLQIAIPGGFVAARFMANACNVIDNGTAETGYCFVASAGTTIGIRRVNDANWSAATDATSVRGQITFEVQ